MQTVYIFKGISGIVYRYIKRHRTKTGNGASKSTSKRQRKHSERPNGIGASKWHQERSIGTEHSKRRPKRDRNETGNDINETGMKRDRNETGTETETRPKRDQTSNLLFETERRDRTMATEPISAHRNETERHRSISKRTSETTSKRSINDTQRHRNASAP
jgi:hypothetical protein